MKFMARWDLRTLGPPVNRSQEFPKDIPKGWFKEVHNHNGVSTTNVHEEVERLDATDHAFAHRWLMMTTQKLEGRWGEKLKEIYEKTYANPQGENSKWRQAMNIASNQWHINCAPRHWKPAAINTKRLEVGPEEMTIKIKNVALYLGAH